MKTSSDFTAPPTTARGSATHKSTQTNGEGAQTRSSTQLTHKPTIKMSPFLRTTRDSEWNALLYCSVCSHHITYNNQESEETQKKNCFELLCLLSKNEREQKTKAKQY
jgi:hypothetical protein